MFESSAILSGSKTVERRHGRAVEFESSAILSGSKTVRGSLPCSSRFESSAILSGSKTPFDNHFMLGFV